ncbi:c-type cytochrome [Nitrogeniibacter aestuarii]|uniref:c-type cytochrome n=1 Tax=Nitrogeniibacter aestuarii TaxID=2815343 RepID=UPI002AB05273|nr:c-type cytochrome [Nitrogeniibacter aestuarii]
MFRFSKTLLAVALVAGAMNVQAFEGLGREATPDEVKAWDIDVRPDFKGLPKGKGNVDEGMAVWEERCEVCHGTFGESNEVFTPIVGGTTEADVQSGHVLALKTGSTPQRTTFMKVATISTLFDYIQRAMPWTEPKSLKPDEVYAILAYLLNLSNVVPADFELSDENIAEVQKLMPNRNGMTTDHGMWPGKGMGNGGKPDTKNVACMKNCKKEVVIGSTLPDYANDAHGNLAEQNRLVGGVRGKVTGEQKEAAPAGESKAPSAESLVKEKGCMACHAVDKKLVGPAYTDVAKKYAGQADAEAVLTDKVKKGGAGVWGTIPMPPQAHVKDEEIQAIVGWILNGAQAQ